MTNILLIFRDVMINNSWIDPVSLIVAVIEVAAFLIIGLRVFYVSQDEFILNI